MNIIQSWKESLSLLKPDNLKPFALVTLKTIFDVYKNINKPLTSRGNWILFGLVAGLVITTNAVKFFHLFWLEAILLNSIRYALIFLFALGLRPSIGQKTWDYFYQKLQLFWYLMVALIVCGIIGLDIIPLFFIWALFFLFAAFDSHGTRGELLVACRLSFLMVLYNFPICLLAYGILGILNVILYYLVVFALSYFGGLTIAVFLYILFIPIEVAIIANLYIKFIHGQPSLYFKQPE